MTMELIVEEDFKPCYCQWCGKKIGRMLEGNVSEMWCGKCRKYSVSPSNTMVVRTREQAKSMKGGEEKPEDAEDS